MSLWDPKYHANHQQHYTSSPHTLVMKAQFLIPTSHLESEHLNACRLLRNIPQPVWWHQLHILQSHPLLTLWERASSTPTHPHRDITLPLQLHHSSRYCTNELSLWLVRQPLLSEPRANVTRPHIILQRHASFLVLSTKQGSYTYDIHDQMCRCCCRNTTRHLTFINRLVHDWFSYLNEHIPDSIELRTEFFHFTILQT